MSPAVRAAEPADISEIVRLARYMYASVGIDADDDWAERVSSLVATRLAGEDLYGWVIDADHGELAACALLGVTPSLPLPGQTSALSGYLHWVATDPRHQRRGLGKALTEAAMTQAETLRLGAVTLYSSPAGRRLYEDCGFSVTPDVHFPDDTRGVPMLWIVPQG